MKSCCDNCMFYEMPQNGDFGSCLFGAVVRYDHWCKDYAPTEEHKKHISLTEEQIDALKSILLTANKGKAGWQSLYGDARAGFRSLYEEDGKA